MEEIPSHPKQKNVYGNPLISCCTDPMTGYWRDGFCRTALEDHGTHVVCAVMNKEFLEFTKSKGNDLSTPNLRYNFPGLQEGDQWCLCVMRWVEAEKAGKAPKIYLKATAIQALEHVSLDTLKKYAIDE
ncbi:DUF2237 family protein [Nonlabens xiamenensis]|uniref:DUF2237 family protein n=1 Tax=Nonlabens xiamenensis TaxID=2341043 RepID=UPI000F60AF62|nr:DUF2237 domain-containing protein [Nonlabens xiamenensis]